MSEPTEIDFALIKMGDGATPEVFTQICGIVDITINKSVSTSDRFVPDCAKPGAVPFRKTRVSGRQMDVSGTGLTNVDNLVTIDAALGVVKNYRIEGYQNDGTDGGALLGTYSGAYRMTSHNMSLTREGDASGEIALASHGEWTYEAA
jgi:hypothetical protein